VREPDSDLRGRLERRLRSMDTLAENLPEVRYNLSAATARGLEFLSLSMHLGVGHEHARRALGYTLDAACAALDASRSSHGETHFTLAGRELVLPRQAPSDLATTAVWQRGFFAALLLRDEERGAWLARFPLAVLEASPLQSLPHTYMAVHTLGGFRLDEGGWQDDLAHTIMLAEAEDQNKEWREELELPVLRMLARIYGDGFSEAFEAALLAHRTYYTRGSMRNDRNGFLALGPAALAAWAHDCDRLVTVESDYAPRWLIEGRF